MPEFESPHFGHLAYDEQTVLEFPAGLPAFEAHTRFLPVEQAATAPVIFLQSLHSADLVFITLPVQLVDPAYQLALSPEDLEWLELPPGELTAIGAEVACLAILTLPEQGRPTANLLAPVVVNLRTRRAAQCIVLSGEYSHQHPLPCAEKEALCS